MKNFKDIYPIGHNKLGKRTILRLLSTLTATLFFLNTLVVDISFADWLPGGDDRQDSMIPGGASLEDRTDAGSSSDEWEVITQEKNIVDDEARAAAEQEAARVAAEEEAIRVAEEARIADQQEAARIAAQEAYMAAEAEVARIEAARLAEESRLAEEARVAAGQEAARVAAEQEITRIAEEATRLAAEEAVRIEAARLAEANRFAEEESARVAAEEASRLETIRLAEVEAARLAAEAQWLADAPKREEAARLTEQARLEASKVYDAMGRLTQMQDARGNYIYYVYYRSDPMKLKCVWNSSNPVSGSKYYPGEEYGPDGLLAEKMNEDGSRIYYSYRSGTKNLRRVDFYNAQQNEIRIVEYDPYTDAKMREVTRNSGGKVLSDTWYVKQAHDKSGRVTVQFNEDGSRTEYSYAESTGIKLYWKSTFNASGNRTSSTEYSRSGGEVSRETIYASDGTIISQTAYNAGKDYDYLGRLVRVQNDNGKTEYGHYGTSSIVEVVNTYNKNTGKIIKRTNYYMSGLIKSERIWGEDGREVSFVTYAGKNYDAQGRVISDVNEDGSYTNYVYSANILTRREKINSFGKQVELVEFYSTGEKMYECTWDSQGQRTDRAYAGQELDGQGRVIFKIKNDGTRLTYSYQDNGVISETKYADRFTPSLTTHYYPSGEKMRELTYANGSVGVVSDVWYIGKIIDPMGRLTMQVNADGSRSEYRYGTDTKLYLEDKYDAKGRLLGFVEHAYSADASLTTTKKMDGVDQIKLTDKVVRANGSESETAYDGTKDNKAVTLVTKDPAAQTIEAVNYVTGEHTRKDMNGAWQENYGTVKVPVFKIAELNKTFGGSGAGYVRTDADNKLTEVKVGDDMYRYSAASGLLTSAQKGSEASVTINPLRVKIFAHSDLTGAMGYVYDTQNRVVTTFLGSGDVMTTDYARQVNINRPDLHNLLINDLRKAEDLYSENGDLIHTLIYNSNAAGANQVRVMTLSDGQVLDCFYSDRCLDGANGLQDGWGVTVTSSPISAVELNAASGLHDEWVTGILATVNDPSTDIIGYNAAQQDWISVSSANFNPTNSSLDTVVDSVDQAIRNAANTNRLKGETGVINLSLEFLQWSNYASTKLQSAIDYARNLGSMIVAAAGNGNTAMMGLSTLQGIITVGAVGYNMMRESWTSGGVTYASNYGPALSFVSYGIRLASTTSGTLMSGTSFAAPVVAATLGKLMAFAQMKKTSGDTQALLAQDDYLDVLAATSKDLGDNGTDQLFGRGLVSPIKAMRKLVQWFGVDAATRASIRAVAGGFKTWLMSI